MTRIRQMASTDRRGTNVLGMVEAANKLGFVAKGVKGPFECLDKIPKPAIAHMVVKGALTHYVVVYQTKKRHLVVMDPLDGRVHKLMNDEFKTQWTGVLILLEPHIDFVEKNERTSVLSRFVDLIRPHRTIMAQALVGSIAYTILGLSVAVYIQKIVDYVLVDGNRNLLNLMSVAMIALLAIQTFVGWMKSLFILRTGQQIDASLILGYYQHLMRLPQRFFDTMRVGEIISRVNDAVKIRAFINDVAITLVVNIFIVVSSFGLIFLYSRRLGVLMLAMIPLFFAVYYITNRVNRRIQRIVMEQAADLESHLIESLNTVRTIKQYGLQWFASLRTEVRFIKLLQSVYRSGTNAIFAGSSGHLISVLFVVILFWTGGTFVLDRLITPGELMASYALLGYLTGPLVGVITMNRTLQDAMIAADRLFEIMDLERDEGDGTITLTAHTMGNIRCERVAFRYGTRRNVFENLNLEILRGKFTAVVGESGCGKSTLVALFQRLYPIVGGRITIGDLDLKHITTASLRKVVGVVPQRLDLFAGNVIDNIAVGELEPDMTRVLDVCRRLGLERVIEEMPDGFHTPLGENGAALSGGEKQRIAIARALYRDPSVLILDEATSSLDSASEKYVEQTLDKLVVEGKTAIVIAHRLSTIMRADQILVLKDGAVVERGSHRELIQNEGLYFSMWKAQFPVDIPTAPCCSRCLESSSSLATRGAPGRRSG